jgi:MSHA biogenesis protein MshO
MNRRLPDSIIATSAKRQGGFTLVEAVIVIVITTIIAAGVAAFMVAPVRGYVDSAARADLADTGDTALRRIARDLRLALPNSVRVSTDGTGASYIELLLTRTGGRYLALEDGASSGAGNILDFNDTSKLKFDIVGPLPSGEQTIQAGSDSVVVFNRGPGATNGDAYSVTAGNMNRTLISSISGPTITMASNVFAQQVVNPPTSTKGTSPQQRFQVISGPVTYRCDPNTGTLTRYWNYTITASQPLSTGALSTGANAQQALMANGVVNCTFSYSTSNSITGALAMLNIKLQASDAGSSTVALFEQVHVDNTP